MPLSHTCYRARILFLTKLRTSERFSSDKVPKNPTPNKPTMALGSGIRCEVARRLKLNTPPVLTPMLPSSETVTETALGKNPGIASVNPPKLEKLLIKLEYCD